MSHDFFRLVYCSRNTIPLSSADREIEQILAAARDSNARVGVTGALLFNKGYFAQTLEGPFDAVQAIFEKIQGDDRHEDVIVLEAEEVEKRSFASWAMAYAGPSETVLVAPPDFDYDSMHHQMASNEVVALLERVVRASPEWIAPAAE